MLIHLKVMSAGTLRINPCKKGQNRLVLTSQFGQINRMNHKEILDSFLQESGMSVPEAVIRGANIGTWICNVKTGETIVNDAWAQAIGYTLAELQPLSAQTRQQFVHPDDLARAHLALQHYLAGQTAQYRCDLRLQHKSGHWIKVLDCGQVLLRDARQQPEWMFGAQIDITELWHKEHENNLVRERLQLLTENLPGFVYQYRLDPQGHASFPYASSQVMKVYGFSPEQIQHDASAVMEVLHPEDKPRVVQNISLSAESLQQWHDLYRVNHPINGVIWVEGSATPKKMPDGSIIWNGYLRDVTAKVQHEEQMKLLSTVYAATQQGVMITDAQVRILEVNPAFVAITGYSAAEVTGRNPSVLSSGMQGREFYQQLWQTLLRDGHWQGEVWNRRKNGEAYPELLTIDALKNSQQQTTHYIGVFSDISLLIERQKNALEQINRDPLTGLANRRLMQERLQMLLSIAKRSGEHIAVCYFDLNNFKALNDTAGHAAGDQLLIDIGQQLQQELRPEDTLARIGGDEFVVLLNSIRDTSYVSQVIARLQRGLEQCSARSKAPLPVNASFGIAICPTDAEDATELLEIADRRMYQAKRLSKQNRPQSQPAAPAAK